MPKPKIPPPPVISFEDRVLLEYALLDHSGGLQPRSHVVLRGRKRNRPRSMLAICKDKDAEGFHLYYCDSEWNPVGFSPSWAPWKRPSIEPNPSILARLGLGFAPTTPNRTPSALSTSKGKTRDVFSAASAPLKPLPASSKVPMRPEYARIALLNSIASFGTIQLLSTNDPRPLPRNHL